MTGSFKCASERGRGKGKIRANRLHREATGDMSTGPTWSSSLAGETRAKDRALGPCPIAGLVLRMGIR